MRGGRKEGAKRGGASCRELPEDQPVSNISWCVTYHVPGGGREMKGVGSIGKGFLGGTGRLGFLIIIKNIFNTPEYFNKENNRSLAAPKT